MSKYQELSHMVRFITSQTQNAAKESLLHAFLTLPSRIFHLLVQLVRVQGGRNKNAVHFSE